MLYMRYKVREIAVFRITIILSVYQFSKIWIFFVHFCPKPPFPNFNSAVFFLPLQAKCVRASRFAHSCIVYMKMRKYRTVDRMRSSGLLVTSPQFRSEVCAFCYLLPNVLFLDPKICLFLQIRILPIL